MLMDGPKPISDSPNDGGETGILNMVKQLLDGTASIVFAGLLNVIMETIIYILPLIQSFLIFSHPKTTGRFPK